MNVEKTKISVEMQATNVTTISAWTGSMIRGAIKNAIAYSNCKSLKYGNCNICKHSDCPNKLLFDRKEQGNAKVQANLIVIDSTFFTEPFNTDKFGFQIELYGDSEDERKLLMDTLSSGIYMGEPRVRWQATNMSVHTSQIELPEFKDYKDEHGHCQISIETPIVSKHLNSDFSIEKFIQLCTLRITGVVNSIGLDYQVPFRELKEAVSGSSLKNVQLTKERLRRKSSVKNRIDNVTGVRGDFEIEGNVDTIMPFIRIASQLGIGKECTMGLGKFEIRT